MLIIKNDVFEREKEKFRKVIEKYVSENRDIEAKEEIERYKNKLLYKLSKYWNINISQVLSPSSSFSNFSLENPRLEWSYNFDTRQYIFYINIFAILIYLLSQIGFNKNYFRLHSLPDSSAWFALSVPTGNQQLSTWEWLLLSIIPLSLTHMNIPDPPLDAQPHTTLQYLMELKSIGRWSAVAKRFGKSGSKKWVSLEIRQENKQQLDATV